jgi:hypothetical protein
MRRCIRGGLFLALCGWLGWPLAGPVRAAAFPQALVAVPSDGAVRLIFQPVEKAMAYNVYRRRVGQKPEQAGSTGTQASPPYFVDNGPGGKGLTNGTPLFYSVTAVVDIVEGPPSPEVVVTPQVPFYGFVDYDIGTLSPGRASLDGRILTLTGSGDGIGAEGEGQTYLASGVSGDFTLSAELLAAPRMVSGADPPSTDEGIVGLEVREAGLFPFPFTELLPGDPYAVVGAFVHHDPEIVFVGQKGAPGGPSQLFSSGQTSFADVSFPLFLRLQRVGTILRAFQSHDGKQWEKVGDDQEFGSMGLAVDFGLLAAAHKEGAYVVGQFDFSTVSLQ